MDAGAADPLRAARPEEGEDKPKPPETADDGYETSNSGETRRKPSSAEASPAPPPDPSPPPEPPYEPLMRYPEPEPEYRHFEPPQQQENPYQHFSFPKYNDPYPFKREADVPYDMSQHHQQAHHQPPPHHPYGPMATKRDDDVYNGIKRECEDPYSFVEEDPMCQMMQPPQHHLPHMHPHQHPHMMHQQMCMTQPKKRGRKKKIKDENGMEIKVEPGMEGALIPRPVKERKKHDRFNGMSEEEVSRRTLPDHLAENLDIIIIGINPGLFAAYKGHHYAGPGNHFWKCLYLSGLTREQMSADEDYKLLNFGIGFTNMVPRATKGSADLTRREIKEGSAVLLEKLQTFRPKVAVFNGKLIYEVFSGKKDFCFGKQPDTIAGTNTYMWVMPSSSARCAQLPRAADKVPFYAALKKFRDYLNGLVPHVEENELVFPDNTSRRPQEEMEIRRLTTEPEPGDTIILEDGTEVPLKKKRGRPKKVKLENGETAPPTPRAPRQPRAPPVLDPNGDQPPKKKRGRPKKIRPEEQQFLMQQQQQQQQANPMLQAPLPSMQSLPHEQGGYLTGGGPGPGAGGGAQAGAEFPPQLPSPLGQGPLMYHQQMNDNATYFQTNPGMESPLDVSNPLANLGRGGYPSPGPGAGAGTGPPGGGYAASPRGVYASPRSQGYSPSPARTPQPQFPASPAAFSAPSPPRAGAAGGGVGAGGAGGAGGGGYASPAGRGGNFAARSPLYAHSPQPYQHQQESLFQSAGSPARFSQSPHSHPHPHPHHPHPYSREPAPQNQARPYSRSPGPGGGVSGVGSVGAAFPAASPGGYGASPHTPYSHHSSPAPPPRTPTYMDQHHHHHQGGSVSTSSGGSGLCAELSSDIGAAISSPPPPSPGGLHVDFDPPAPAPRDDSTVSPLPSAELHPGSDSSSDLPDYNKSGGSAALSPGGGGSFARALYDADSYSQPEHDHYSQEQGNGGVPESPRLDQLHQHPSMYPTNFSRSTPEGGVGVGAGGEGAFSPAGQFRTHTPHNDSPHTHYDTGSPGEYAGVKAKSQDVASKSLSGLESLVDQIPSIAEGPGGGGGAGGTGAGAPGGTGAAGGEVPPPAPVPALPEYAPALYPPYGAYGGAPYPNNGYGSFVGYGGGWAGAVGAVMRPAPGYLSEWQYGYGGVAPAYASPYNAPYYNSYSHPPPAHHQQTHYLSAPPLLELHKNGEHSGGVPAVPSVPSVPSVGFGGFC